MPFAKKVVLHCPNGVPSNMTDVAARFVADGVIFVGAVGPACREVECIVDDASLAAGSPERNFILTSSHPDESLEDAVMFAQHLRGEYAGEIQVVVLL